MTYEQVRKEARSKMTLCSSCTVCNGAACGSRMPGPGCKGSGKVAKRNYDAWQDILLNLDTIGVEQEPDTTLNLWNHIFTYPIFAAPMGVVQPHFGELYPQDEYDSILVRGCCDSGIAAFTADGLEPHYFVGGCDAIKNNGFGIPTIKPRNWEVVREKIDAAKERGVSVLCMDIDAAGLPFLKHNNPPSGRKTVDELRRIIEYADMPFILKGIMTADGARKALDAGVDAIVVSNHGGRVLDSTPATAWVLNEIAEAVGNDITILVDGGIRSGLDVFKALALGADAVLIGRPFASCIYGGREDGIRAFVSQIGSELKDTMQMCGVNALSEIGMHNLW